MIYRFVLTNAPIKRQFKLQETHFLRQKRFDPTVSYSCPLSVPHNRGTLRVILFCGKIRDTVLFTSSNCLSTLFYTVLLIVQSHEGWLNVLGADTYHQNDCKNGYGNGCQNQRVHDNERGPPASLGFNLLSHAHLRQSFRRGEQCPCPSRLCCFLSWWSPPTSSTRVTFGRFPPRIDEASVAIAAYSG
jgi:hypothetical protein